MRNLRIRFRVNQKLLLMNLKVRKWWWSWNGATLHVIRDDGRKLTYPSWAVAGAEEVD
jgi:hypothetical protein